MILWKCSMHTWLTKFRYHSTSYMQSFFLALELMIQFFLMVESKLNPNKNIVTYCFIIKKSMFFVFSHKFKTGTKHVNFF